MYQKQMYDITEVFKMIGKDTSSIYTQVDFPSEVISAFTDFIKGD